MRSFQLVPVLSDDTYRLYFDSDLSFTFNSKREALIFAAKVSKFFTSHWSSLNELYSTSFTIYRRLFLVLNTSVVRIKDDFDIVDDILFRNLMFHSGVNGAYFSFNGLLRGYRILSEVIVKMIHFVEKRKITSDIYQLKNILRSIELHQAELKGFDYKAIPVATKVIVLSEVEKAVLLRKMA